MMEYLLRRALDMAALMLSIISAQARQQLQLLHFVEALRAGMEIGQSALDGQPVTRAQTAAVRKEFNEALDALESLLP